MAPGSSGGASVSPGLAAPTVTLPLSSTTSTSTTPEVYGVTPACGIAILLAMSSTEDRHTDRLSGFRGGSLIALSDNLALVAGLVLAISSFTGWYTGPSGGVTVSVTGWHTGPLGKLVFFAGLAVLLVVLLREIGIELPAAAPESLVTIALGAVATIFVLIRIVSIPDDFFFAGRGVGIWISLIAAIGVIAAGLLQVSEEL